MAMYDHVYKYTTPKVCRKYADLHARVGGVSHLPQHPSGASYFSFSSSLRSFSITSLSLFVIALRLFRLVFSSLRSTGPLIVLRLFGTSFLRASLDASGSFVISSVLASAAFAFPKKAALPLRLSMAGADFRLSLLGVTIPSS